MGAWRFLSWWNGRNGDFFQSCREPGSFDSFQRKCEICEIPYQKLWIRVSRHRWKFSLCANSRRLCPRRNFFYGSQWFWVRDPCPIELRIWGFDLFGGPRQACHQQVRCAREFTSSCDHRYTQWRTFLRWPFGRCMCSSWCPSRANLCGDYRWGRIWSSSSSSSLDALIGFLCFLVYSFYAFSVISSTLCWGRVFLDYDRESEKSLWARGRIWTWRPFVPANAIKRNANNKHCFFCYCCQVLRALTFSAQLAGDGTTLITPHAALNTWW